jgi:hypothetical protein
MYRFLQLLLSAFILAAQTPLANLDKPPQDIDEALRARIKQFYDLHVAAAETGQAAKYRQAERLIAEESKDDFYVLSKPELHSYRIADIEYSEKFTKAKVVIVGAMPALLPMAGAKIMDFPFASYWKIEDGVWCWYYNKEPMHHTPFGDVKAPPPDSKPGATPAVLPAAPNPTSLLATLQSALKIDHTRIDLIVGQPQTVKVTNTLPGPASLTVECPNKPLAQTGITASFDKKDLKGNETAVLTLTAGPGTSIGIVPLLIIVSPTNQVLNLSVSVSR